MKLLHLVDRFFRALWPFPPRAADRAWVATILTPDELSLFERMPNHDRRHAIGVARGVEAQLAGTRYAGEDRWLATALLHDIGKLDARLGVYGRVVATLSGAAAGHDAAYDWSRKSGFTRRVGLYLRHPELGGDRIDIIEGRPEAAAWARAHHDPASWPTLDLPPEVIAALDHADND